jgi:hypothetical protein
MTPLDAARSTETAARAKVVTAEANVSAAQSVIDRIKIELAEATRTLRRRDAELRGAKSLVTEAGYCVIEAAASTNPTDKAASVAAVLARPRKVMVQNVIGAHGPMTVPLQPGEGVMEVKRAVRDLHQRSLKSTGKVFKSLRVRTSGTLNQAMSAAELDELEVAGPLDLVQGATLVATYAESKAVKEARERGTFTVEVVGALTSSSKARTGGKCSITVGPLTTLRSIKASLRDHFGKVARHKLGALQLVHRDDHSQILGPVKKMSDLTDGVVLRPTYAAATGNYNLGGYLGAGGARGWGFC